MKIEKKHGYIEITSPQLVKLCGILAGVGTKAKAAACVPFIITDGSLHGKKRDVITNHELIHFRQQLETLFIGQFLISFLERIIFRFVLRKSAWQTYLWHSGEQEAYDNMWNLDYLSHRKTFAHLRFYFFQKKVSSPEVHKKLLILEGFPYVYEWKDVPGTIYEAHSHSGRVSLYIEKGSVIFNFNERSILLREGDRIDVPPGEVHRALVGSDGCEFVVGEEIEGDS